MARRRRTSYLTAMFSLFAWILGVAGLLLGVVAFIPLLGWGYWLIVPIAILGLGLALIARNRGAQWLNIAVIVVGMARLSLGGGVI
jgi:fatty acid desaturase